MKLFQALIVIRDLLKVPHPINHIQFPYMGRVKKDCKYFKEEKYCDHVLAVAVNENIVEEFVKH